MLLMEEGSRLSSGLALNTCSSRELFAFPSEVPLFFAYQNESSRSRKEQTNNIQRDPFIVCQFPKECFLKQNS